MVRLAFAGLALCMFAVPGSARDMNISQFVFRDLNRNGVYDLGESPFSGVRVRLEQENAEPLYRNSNLAGFANFPMSDDEPDQDITKAGAVSFAVELPEGYVLTTGNPEQRAVISSLAGAPGGFVMDPPNEFVGLAPALTIESSGEGVASMSCSSGPVTIAGIPERSELVCPVGPGAWQVVWTLTDGSEIAREVTVDQWPIRVPVAPLAPGGNSVRVETFEGVIGSENIQEMPSSDGFIWHNFVATHRKFYGGWGYVNGAASGEFIGYNSSGHPATIRSDEPFEFRGSLVSVAWPKGRNAPVRFRGLRDGEIVAEETFFASNMRPVWFDARWAGIDTLVVSHEDFWQVVVDDLTLAR